MVSFTTNSIAKQFLLLSGIVGVASAACGGNNVKTCSDCLNKDGCDAWAAGQCFVSCQFAPSDIACYSSSVVMSNGNDNMTVTEICDRAAADAADAELCSTMSDCQSCVNSVLSDGTTTCQWFEEFNFCNNGCGMMGCGDTTCSSSTTVEGNNTSNCERAVSCEDCLKNDDVASSCVWVPVQGCLGSCDMIADTSCYDLDYFPNMTNKEICLIASESAADSDLCTNKTDCESCVNSVLSDGVSTCQWFEDGGYCDSDCGMNGCGDDTCSSSSANVTTTDCVKFDTCGDCLMGSCVWVPVEGCLDSCDRVADTGCYDFESFPNMTSEEVCLIASKSAADSDLCGRKLDCESCLNTILSDGVHSCLWFEDGYCGSTCGMNGCGISTCPSSSTPDSDMNSTNSGPDSNMNTTNSAPDSAMPTIPTAFAFSVLFLISGLLLS